MKIRAIRVAEVGRFSSPMAVENLADGLNVLAGPNELGKSTLLKALRLALLEKHTSKQAEIAALRPYGGGNPTIEVDFESHNHVWRVRKRFLGQPLAELRSLQSNQLWRGPDVDGQLEKLLADKQNAANPHGRFGLLWVGQQGTLRTAEPEDLRHFANVGDTLERALSGEVMALAQGERSKQIRAAIRDKLAEVLTPKGARPKAQGALDVAQKNAQRLRTELASAEAELARARENLDKLGLLREQEQALSHAEAVHARQQAMARAEAAVEAARDAVVHRDLALAALKNSESDLLRHREQLQRFASARQELVNLEANEQSTGQVLADAEQALASALGDEERATLATNAARATVQSLIAEHAAAVSAERRLSQAARIAELNQRLDAVSAGMAEANALRGQAAAINATPALLDQARRTEREIQKLQAQLDAVQPTLVIRYRADAKGRAHVDGRPLADGEAFRPSRTTMIELDGIGQLTIDPGGSDTLIDLSGDLAAHREQLSAILAKAGATDVAALDHAVEHLQSLQSKIGELTAIAKAIAPGGVERLSAELTALRDAMPADEAPQSVRSITAIEEAGRKSRQALATQERELAQLQASIAGIRTEIAKRLSERQHGEQRRAELQRLLPDRTTWDQHHGDLASAVTAAESAANAAQRELTAWSEKAPDHTAGLKLDAAVEVADKAIRDADRRLFEFGTEAARIDGELAAARSEDIESRVESLSAETTRAESALADIADDIAALQLLEAELSAESNQTRDLYLAPVLGRLKPLVHRVLPGAEVELNAGFAPGGLLRGARVEQLHRLSDGTREQIAVLARLAIAGLFASSGNAVPVIFDDALVYADDDRIEAMFDVLRQSAEHHQVIVLTCRAAAFSGLGGNPIELQPWREALS